VSVWLVPILFAVAVYAYLKSKKYYHYRRLLQKQSGIIATHEPALLFRSYRPVDLPSFDERIVTIADLLPTQTLQMLRNEALAHAKTERSYFPGHKKGGTISYEELHINAPRIVAFYHSRYLRNLCSAIVGERLMPTPIYDQSSCSLLFYDKPRDHIGWHYDYNFYKGRHFTALLPLINSHDTEERLSSAQLVVKKDGAEITVPTPPNTLVLFEGARVYHKVTRLEANETRVILSMTFCADPRASFIKGIIRRVKDTAYFGLRALWT